MHLLVSKQYIDSIMHGATIKVVFGLVYQSWNRDKVSHLINEKIPTVFAKFVFQETNFG